MTSQEPVSALLFKNLAEKLSDRERPQEDLTPFMKWKLRFQECVDERGRLIDKELWIKLKKELYTYLSQVPGEACYIPGETQWEAHLSTEMTKQVAGGWRAGKSKFLAAELLPYMFIDRAHIWLVANTYELARAEFGYIKEWLQWMRASFYKDAKPQAGRWSIGVIGGGLLDTQTADDVTKLEMVNLNAVGIAEAGQVYHEIFLRLKGRVMEKGGPINLSGSFESSLVWYLKEFEAHLNGGDDWHSWSIPSWENAIIFPLGRQDPKILKQERELPEELFKLKIAAQVVRPPELVYPQFDPKRNVTPMYFGNQTAEIEQALGKKFEGGFNTRDPYPIFGIDGNVKAWILPEPGIGDIELAIDPGFNPGAYAVLVMYKLDPYVFCIAEIYKHQSVHETVIAEARDQWWFRYVTRGTIDNAGGQHHADRSAKEVWAAPYDKGGAALNLESQKITIQDGMQRTRTMLEDPLTRKPKLFFDPSCKQTIGEFDRYRYPPGREMGSQRDVPIDRDNHSMKALGYWLVRRIGLIGNGRGRVTSVKYIRTGNQQWQENNGMDPYENGI